MRLVPIVAIWLSILTCAISASVPSESAPSTPATSGYRVLHAFLGGLDGKFPNAVIELDGTLYGTTQNGGSQGMLCPDPSAGCGTIFKVTSAGVESIIYRFPGVEHGGDFPSTLTSIDGRLFGTTVRGGIAGSRCCGTVFAVKSTGNVDYLHKFRGGADGIFPSSSIGVGGLLYGTTFYDGRLGPGCQVNQGCGTVFAVTATGMERVVYRFKGAPDGSEPSSLYFANSTLYGTTQTGGSGNCPMLDTKGCGTVFAIEKNGAEHVIYSFKGGSDGNQPTNVIDVGGTLYGTTNYGGGGPCKSSLGNGCGTVFAIDRNGAERVLYSFEGRVDGSLPGGLVELNGALVGTTAFGGNGCNGLGCGTVFKLSTGGKKVVLHRFVGGIDGEFPNGAPLAISNGAIYGATGSGGGACSCGVVYSLSP